MPDGGSDKPADEQLQAEIAELRRQLAGKDELIKKLLERIEQLERAGKRQAAPFSKGEPKPDPKKPGRKPGDKYGTHARGAVPPHVDETVDVPLPTVCPDCGGPVEECVVRRQYQTEIPKVEPFVRQFDIHIGNCRNCGKRVQPRHELQTSDALGAANVGWGPHLIAFAVRLNKYAGVSTEKIVVFVAAAFGVMPARSAVIRAILRVGNKLRPTYDIMVAALPEQPLVCPDETGFRQNGLKMWLWAFVAANFTVYRIAQSRGSDVVLWALTQDFAGALGRDGWAAYGVLLRAFHQTCLAHLLRRCNDILEIAPGRAVEYPQKVKALLTDALALRDRRVEPTGDGVEKPGDEFDKQRDALEARLDELIDCEPTWEPNRKLAGHIRNERHAILTFLYFACLEATNWPAEHAMRFAVILRKICGGTRSEAGSRAHETLLSIERTCRQQGLNPLDIYVAAQRSPVPLKIDLTGPPLPEFHQIDHRLFSPPLGRVMSAAPSVGR